MTEQEISGSSEPVECKKCKQMINPRISDNGRHYLEVPESHAAPIKSGRLKDKGFTAWCPSGGLPD